jgi:hypothetical protein
MRLFSTVCRTEGEQFPEEYWSRQSCHLFLKKRRKKVLGGSKMDIHT